MESYDESGLGWSLTNVVQTRFLPDRTEPKARQSAQTGTDPGCAVGADGGAGVMSVETLYSYIRHLEENNQRTTRYEIALWKKPCLPVCKAGDDGVGATSSAT